MRAKLNQVLDFLFPSRVISREIKEISAIIDRMHSDIAKWKKEIR